MLGKPIDNLSKGFKRRVGLAQAIIHDPAILILDEPTDGLDPNQKHQVRNLIKSLAKDKIVIVSTHILEEVTAVCNRVMIIAGGKKCFDDTPESLLKESKYYNAINLTLDRASDEATLSGPRFSAVEKGDNERNVILFSGKKEASIESLKQHLENNGCKVEQLFIEQGRLDEVFRVITQKEALMNMIGILFKREFGSFFATPVAYVFILIFLMLSGVFTFYIGNFFEREQADLLPFFNFHPGFICCGYGHESLVGGTQVGHHRITDDIARNNGRLPSLSFSRPGLYWDCHWF